MQFGVLDGPGPLPSPLFSRFRDINVRANLKKMWGGMFGQEERRAMSGQPELLIS